MGILPKKLRDFYIKHDFFIETVGFSIVICLAVYISVQYTLIAGILMLVPLLVYRIVKHRIIKRKEKARHKAMQAVIDNKQLAEDKFTALNAVMNPHFMFNSLNAIQYFMVKNEKKMALDSLSLFSRFIRKILDSASANRISLKAELEILHHYIKLEQIRFSEKFSFSIHIDPMVDSETIFIPSLLIQPYVEHAIMNCLLNKDGQGLIAIHILKNENYLVIIIEDNGIEQKEEKETSTLFPRDLVERINKHNNVSVHVMHHKNNEGELLGTKVSITIDL